MPQERFSIVSFDKGIIKRADSEDIPDNAASDSNNIDADAAEGILKAIPTSTAKTMGTTTATAGRLFDWIKTKDSKWNLVYADAGYLNIVTDFYAASPASYFGATAIATTATSMVVHNEEVRVANGLTTGVPTTPTWIGNCDYGHFGGASKSWQYASAGISRPIYTTDYEISAVGHAGTSAFEISYQYEYMLSFVYDGIQESPLGSAPVIWSMTGTDIDYVTLTITLKSVSSLNARVTGIKLYRKERNLYSDASVSFITLYRLMQSIDVTNTVGYVDRNGSNVSWGTSGVDKTITYVDNNTDILSSYEEQTNISETLTTTDVYYSLNTDLNAYHYVAGCYKSGMPESAFLAFRSKQYRYDMFDWTRDYLKLPSIPTAWKAFNGKIWAFDENNAYRINADGFYIEDTTVGVGCLSQRSIVITDYGMFWCDYKNAYWHDGEQIRTIGDAIKTDVTATYDWTGFAKNYTVGEQSKTPVVVFHSLKNLILFIVPDHTGSYSNVWTFHVTKQRWDSWLQFTACGNTSTGFGAFVGKFGETYVATGSSMLDALSGNIATSSITYRAFYWVSKVLDFGNPSLNKVFYRPTMDSTALTAAPTITYGKNRATPTTSLTSSEFKSGGNYEEGKLLQVKITEATGYGNSVYSLDITLRKFFEL